MATVTGLTAARMLAIEGASIVDGDVVGDNLILTKHDGTTVNAGNVRGPIGPTGLTGAAGANGADASTNIAARAASAAPSTYPTGSLFTFVLATGNVSGYPFGTAAGTVFTQITNTSNGFQLAIEKSTGNVWIRHISGTDVWGSFVQLATKSYVDSLVPVDSGWVNLTPASGWAHSPTTGGPATAQCRKIGNEIKFRGALTSGATTLTAATTTVIAQIPSGYFNGSTRNYKAINTSGGFVGWGNVQEAGQLQAHFKSPYVSATNVIIEISGMSYMLN